MTLPPLERYAGREQAYVKHYFLATYLERLVHKVARSYGEVVYVDGFSGPWQSADEDFADTSFGIALTALRTAKASWQKMGRDVRMKAILVESREDAYASLQTLQPKYPDVEIVPIKADFRSAVERIAAAITSDAFAFILIDPKGWRIPINAIAPLLMRQNAEVLFNFMFDFINRAASMSSAATIQGLNELLPVGGWREALAEVDLTVADKDRPAARKLILINAFRQVLREKGGYRYVAEVPVLRPLKDRTLYSLVYATRSPKGIEVFRDCQVKTLEEQDSVRGAAKVSAATAASGQGEFFGTLQGLGPDTTSAYLQEELRGAEATLLSLIPVGLAARTWGDLWPDVLERHAVRKTDVNAIAGRLRKEGTLVFPDWQPLKRVPEDSYRVRRP